MPPKCVASRMHFLRSALRRASPFPCAGAPPPIRAADLEVAENTEKKIAIASSGADAKNGCDVCAIKCWTKEGFLGNYGATAGALNPDVSP